MDQLFTKDKYTTSNYLFMKQNQPSNRPSDEQKVRIKQLHQTNDESLKRLLTRLRSNKNGECFAVPVHPAINTPNTD